MKHDKDSRGRVRAKAAGIAAGALVVGVGLIVLSRVLVASAEKAAAAETRPATATATAAAPADHPPPDGEPHHPPAGRDQPASSKALAAQRLGALLLLFGLMGVGLAVLCTGWIIYDIRRSRPAWKTQTKYPVRVSPKKMRKG
ncbi:MAG: hypothetical protein HY718_06310 [Planctomycetes bacterium]|nr:hypothetical protein [Planctomycetota bacterium]